MSTIATENIVINYVLTSDQINKTKASFDNLTTAEKKAVDETKKLNDGLKEVGSKGSQNINNAGNELNKFSGIAKSGAGLLATYFSVSAINAFREKLVETTIKFEGYAKAIEFGSGSAENYAKNQLFLNDLISKYGLDLAKTTEAYKSFFNASTLAGQSQKETNRQFEAVTKAGTVLKLTTDQMQGAFLALGQMMSKGTVQAEELRGQLGERIPGAFSIMAKALNVNERQLNKMLEQGQVLSKTALPAFAAELEKTFGPAAEKNLNGLVNAQNRFNSAIDGLVVALGKRLEPMLRGSYELAAGIANELKKLYDPVGAAFEKGAQAGKKASEEALNIAIVNQNRKLREIKKEFDLKNDLFTIDGEISALEELEIEKTRKKYELEKAFRDGLLVNLANYKEEKKVKEEIAEKTQTELKKEYDLRLANLELERKSREQRAIQNQDEAGKTQALEIFLGQRLALEREYYGKLESITKKQIFVTQQERGNALTAYEKAFEESLLKQYQGTEMSEKEKEKLISERLKNEMKTREQWMKENEKSTNDFNDREYKKLLETERQKREAIQVTYNMIGDSVQSAFQLQSAFIDKEIAQLNKRYDAEIRLAGDNEQKIVEINEKRQREEAELRRKQFEAQRQAAISEVVFRVAPIIAQQIAGVITAPLAIASYAAAAAQIAFIAAQPVPEFAEGTKGKAFKGKAIVGEKGTEKVITESGKVYYTPNVATLAQFDEPVQIIPNNQLGLNDRKHLSLVYANSSKKDNGTPKIVSKLDSLESTLKNLPIWQLNMNEKGFEKFVRTPKRTTKILNTRFGK